MPEKPISNKLIANRIPIPEKQQETSIKPLKPPVDKSERLREFSIRFTSLFRGMTNAEIARKLGTTDAVVKNYVEGKRFPNDDLLMSITQATKVNLHWLLTGEGSPNIEADRRIFDDAEEEKINRLAELHRRSFDDEVRALVMAAVEFIEKI